MLGIAVHSLACCPFHLRSAQLAGEQAVLRIVFKVSAGEWRAMNVHARRVEAHHTVGGCFHGEDLTELFNQFHIPGCADDRFTGEGYATKGADQGVDACRSVQIGGGGFSHALDGRGRPAAVQDHPGHVVIRQLLQQLFPLGIIPGETCHVGEGQAVVGIHDGRVAGIYSVGCFIGESVHHGGGSFFPVRPCFGHGAFPVSAGHVHGDLSVFHIRETGNGSSLVCGAGISLAVDHCLGDLMGSAVNHFMGVVHQLDLISARFQHIAARAFAVEGCHVLLAERDRQHLRFSRLQEFRFRETRQYHVSFLDAAFGVRRGIVNLRHILARGLTGIGHLHLQDDVPAAVHKVFDGLGEGCITQTETKGILHGGIIIDITIRRRCFIVAVAYINPFGVFNIIALQVAVGEAACIIVSRRRSQVISVNISQASGGIHLTGQRLAHCVEANSAGAADPQAGVHAFHKTQFHGIGGVDQHDHLAIILALDQVQQILFILGQFQIVPPIICLAVSGSEHVLRQVAALAADAGDDDDRGIRIFTYGFQELFRVFVGRYLGRGEIGAGIASLFGTTDTGILIEIDQLVIDLQTRVGEPFDHIHIGGGITAAAARAAIDGINGSIAEEVDFCAVG